MARKLRIPRLVPDGTACRVETHSPARPRTGRRPDSERLASEPWRADGYGSAYRRSRQAVIERQRGRCAVTGEQVAVKVDGTWRISQPGAGVHHRVALCDGGADDQANLVLLSASAHARIDAERRRGEGSE
ncbi:HNH endonuclease [Paraeggerthella sp. Marseille-Q4926]|uniref:HNH endonuclease n=1 Tax=Paraeggerthella sp. Marseille-Q4926 TaxID=2866587 RepID=UPI001CE3E8F8|nr:HNH endonuclease signature motif containing protein [Paraeggerthella sp. Marseille-Q4926]